MTLEETQEGVSSEAQASPQMVLKARNVGLFYNNKLKLDFRKRNRFWALEDVSFDLFEGECLGIIGRNGAGKSTLLRLIAGIHRPDRGFIDHYGHHVALLTLGAGFVNHLSGRDNMILSSKLLGMESNQIRERLPAMVEYSELGRFIDEPIYSYSSGMRARLGFAVAVQSDAKILLIDETLGVGDAAFREKSSQTIQEMILAETRTVVLITHNHQTIQELATRVVVLKDGRIKEGESGELIQEYLRESYATVGNKRLNQDCQTVDEQEEAEERLEPKVSNAEAWHIGLRQAMDIIDQDQIREFFDSREPHETDRLADHRLYMFAAARLGEYRKAIEHVEKCERLQDDATLCHLKSWYYFGIGEISNCVDSFISVLDRFGGDRDRCAMLAYLFALLERKGDSRRFQDLQITYDSPLLATTLGVSVSQLMGHGFEGVRDIIARESLDEGKKIGRELAYANFYSGDYDAANSCFEALDSHSDKDFLFHARALRILGDLRNSRSKFELGASKVPRNLAFRVELASIDCAMQSAGQFY